jgi:hypothetical protein
MGVSKPCCPVCTEILAGTANPFFFRSSHEVLTACTLPNWVPASIALAAVDYYKVRLRIALDELVTSQTLPRNRFNSIQSDAISLGSVDSDDAHVSSTDFSIQ